MEKLRYRRRAYAAVAAIGLPAAAIAATAGNAAPERVAAAFAVPVPRVQGPIPSTASPGDLSHDYIFYATTWPLAKNGSA